ncbi:MAG: aminopeptidase P N-terminal domain-containing protein [Bacteroidetes bacterium]|nr:aminopeptidase P N-terminal domain-containing protein [Bacteroidota bacterium]MBS1630197.1 aminopeptidase P N-terminal domain-containing protein [Bacteroidota bacterium]
MKYSAIDPKLFIQNRQRFTKAMKPNSLAIFPGNLNLLTNGDQTHPYVPNSDVLWLSGVRQEHTMVVLYPDNPDTSAREVLVILRPNEQLEKWEGHKLTKAEASAISGIKNVQFADSVDAMLQTMMHHADTVYLNTDENDRMDGSLFRPDLEFVKQWMARFPLHRYERAARILKDLRSIKTKEEIVVVQEAIDITEKAFRRVMQFIRPGVMEYELEAEITHEFLCNRATRHAYGCIIASGDRARVLHYVENNQECKDGEIVLMDFGAEYGNYAADLTRSIPVNGKFSKRQAQVYNAVLHVHNFARGILKPGISINDYTKKVNDETEKQCLKIGLISKSDIKNQDPENPAYRKYFYHGVTHHLGLDVHDLGTRVEPIKAGMLFTVEPGLYIEEEQIGIRIENDVWITRTGNQDLMKNIPITVEEIEAAMKKK